MPTPGARTGWAPTPAQPAAAARCPRCWCSAAAAAVTPVDETRTVPVDVERLDRVHRARRRPAEVGPSPDDVRSAGDFERVSLPHSDADVLRDILVAGKARVVIEIGLAYGSSALAIAEALLSVSLAAADTEDTRHVIIDAFQDQFHDAGWHALITGGLAERCTLRRERSQLALSA